MQMLSLLPISGFSGLRNKAKAMDLKRRDSSGNIYSQSLPSAARRFSSYEELGPLFQSLVVAPDVQKSRSLLRRHNLHQSVKASKSSASRDAAACEELDAKLACIRGQLTRLKSEHADMSNRVDDLTISVGQLYQSNRHRIVSPPLPCAAMGADPHPAATFVAAAHARSSSTASDPGSVFKGAREICAVSQEVDESPRVHCLQNNLGKPRSRSAAQLTVIRNDFSSAVSLSRKVSCKSDSVIFEQRNKAAAERNAASPAETH